jgi:hypothetical protein
MNLTLTRKQLTYLITLGICGMILIALIPKPAIGQVESYHFEIHAVNGDDSILPDWLECFEEQFYLEIYLEGRLRETALSVYHLYLTRYPYPSGCHIEIIGVTNGHETARLELILPFLPLTESEQRHDLLFYRY